MRRTMTTLVFVAITVGVGCAPRAAEVRMEERHATSLEPSGGEAPPNVVVVQTGGATPVQPPEIEQAPQGQTSSTGGVWRASSNPGVDTRDPLNEGELRFARGVPMGTNSSTAGGFYGESLNPDSQFDGNCGGTSLAIMYVPAANFELRSIAVHASVATLGILDDANGRPGAVLAMANTAASQDAGWFEATLSQPISLRAGVRYWLFKSEGGCSRATQGNTPLYYGNFHGTSGAHWEGPHRWHPFVARMYGRAL